MRYFLILILLLSLGAFAYWFMFYKKNNTPPYIPPTAQEIQRMKEIDKTSSEIAPDAVAGAGVRPVGSLPKAQPKPVASSTSASSTITGTSTATTTN